MALNNEARYAIMSPDRNGKQFDLEEFIHNATWRELLVELVERNELDPWDVDISKIVDEYITEVRKIKSLTLTLPANMILAASILLRMKSDAFYFETDSGEEELASGMDVTTRPREDPGEMPELVYKARLRPGRRVTLEELMDALDEMMAAKIKREEISHFSDTPLQIVVDRDDIDEKIEHAYGLINSNLDSYGLTTFSALATNFANMDGILINLFIPLLFLAQNERIMLAQEEFFGDIIIKIREKREIDAG